jgi:hypothetical protein
MDMKYLFSTILFLFISIGFAQDGELPMGKTMADYEQELTALGNEIVTGVTEEERLTLNKEFNDLLYDCLLQDESFDYPFEKVRNLSKLTAESKQFRLFTWLVPLKDGTFQYNGMALVKQKHGLEIIDLKDQSAEMEKPEYAWLKPSKWFGAIYYQTFEVKYKKNRYQVYLGYRPGDRKVQEKIIEVVQLKNGKLEFGAKIFETPLLADFKYAQRPYRLRLRYSKKVVASLKYVPAEKMIIMDHLSPPDASMKGQWELYGPDFSYDGLEWEDGKFQLRKQIEFNSGLQQVIPEQRPQQGLAPKKEEEDN